jgi:2-polyprenyl-3-methyl-5-hydroxy-6-metoxy-1,4-benzoquinol methylase
MTAPESTVDLGEPQFGAFDKVVRRMRSRVLAPHLPAGGRVLDYGCGEENWFLNATHDRFSIGHGVDPLLRPHRDATNVTSMRGTLQQLLADQPTLQFDAIFWVAVVEHHEPHEADASLSLCRDHLAPGGRIVMTTPTPQAKLVLEFMAFKLKIISRESIEDHRLYYDRSKMSDLFTRNGFRMTSYQRFQLGLNSIAVAENG